MKFESRGSSRTYILNRPAKLNALDENMLLLLRPKIEVRLLIPMSLLRFISFSYRNGVSPNYVVQLSGEAKVVRFVLGATLQV